MKYFPTFLMLSLMLVLNAGIKAQLVAPERAQKIAQNLYAERAQTAGMELRQEVGFRAVDQISRDNKAAIYIFNESNGNGYVLVSADERAYPVLGYSFEGSFSKHELFPSIEAWLDNYCDQIAEIRTKDYRSGAEAKEAWKCYEKPARSAVRSVEPMVTSIYGQDCYYNELCPVDPAGACGHARVGCVATAMAQILRYHKAPMQGTGTHSYNSSYGMLTVNFGAATYDYDQMPDYVTDYNYEVAELCYHCGVSVDMGYGPQGSGAYSQDVDDALINHFGCDPSTTVYHSKSAYTNEEWENMVREDLDNGRPLYYSGSGSGGHAFVLDGYQDYSHFHFNWGWGGLYNGYYFLNNLNPGTHNYSSNQAAVFGIQSADAPVVDFSVSTTEVLTGEGVDFEDLSTSNPNQWQWTFEGASPSSSTDRNPQNINYFSPGTYNVTLRSWNANGDAFKLKTDFITVSDDALPIADFDVDDTVVYVEHSSVKFHNHSLNAASSFKWMFEPSSVSYTNGTSSESEEPRVRFNEAGQYSVTLIAENENGNDTMVRQQYIFAGGYPIPFYENFELAFVFTDKWEIENNDGSVTWDGYYKISGNGDSRRAAWMNFYEYTAIDQRDQLISPALNTVGHEQLFLDFVHAYASYSASRRDSLIVKVSTNAGASWQRVAAFGEDGNGSFATTQPSTNIFEPSSSDEFCGTGYGSDCYHLDLSPWTGNPNLKIMFEAWNGNGNCLYVDDVLVHDPGVYADFNADITEFCENGNVNFYDNARGEPTSWQWTFEGATPASSTEQNPEGIYYDAPGFYAVQLIVSNGEYSDTIVKEEYISVLTTPGQASMPNAPDDVCQNGSNSFVSVAPVTYAQSYNWELNPAEAGIVSANGTFASINWNEQWDGLAELSVQAVNMCGEGAVSDPKAILIHESPVSDAGEDQVIEPNQTVSLNGNATGAGGSYSFHWEPTDLLVNPDLQNVESLPLENSQWFWLVASDTESGCESDADSVFVRVQGDVLGVEASASPAELCAGETSQLSALATGGAGNYTYNWTSDPAGFQSDEAEPEIQPQESAWYFVHVSDGESQAQDSVFVTVYPLPDVDLGPDSAICHLDYYQLDAGEAEAYLWSNGETGRYISVFMGDDFVEGENHIWVDVTNEYSCTKRDSVIITIEVCSATNDLAENRLALYPNPAKEKLTLHSPGLKDAYIRIYAADGREVKQISGLSGSNLQISIAELPEGIYFLRLSTDNYVINKKFVISR